MFSEVKGLTIQQFIIIHKVERIKELIIYDELNITEIAWKLNYSVSPLPTPYFIGDIID